jgi:hypothetical protein
MGVRAEAMCGVRAQGVAECVQGGAGTEYGEFVAASFRSVLFLPSFLPPEWLTLPSTTAPQSMEGLLLKEAVYTAVGRSPSDLEGSINFQEWLEGTLVPECAGTDSECVSLPSCTDSTVDDRLRSYRIIRRRIAWLLGNWVGEDLAASSRSRIYSLLIHLLSRNDSTDPAIRLTAARSLAKCDTWDFDQQAFVPLLPRAIEEIVQLLGEVQMSDSRMRLNQTLGVVIDRVGSHVRFPFICSVLSTYG